MIIRIALSSLVGGSLVLTSEALRLRKLINRETSRKIIHITHSLVIVYWSFIATNSFIIAAEILFLIVVLLARKFSIMQPLRSVNRNSWGEIFFPFGVIGSLLLAPSNPVFLAAMLHLGLADALAALVGSRVKKGEYLIFSQRKTVAGTGTFFVVSLLIMFWLVRLSSTGYVHPSLLFLLLFIPFIATFVENYSPYGSDNVSLPILVVCLLNLSATGFAF
jgi:phytol kinase